MTLATGTGKNRPLDEDELDFVNAVERTKAAAERAWRDEQDREMDAFREVRVDGMVRVSADLDWNPTHDPDLDHSLTPDPHLNLLATAPLVCGEPHGH